MPHRSGDVLAVGVMHTTVPTLDYLPARMVNEYVYCPRLFHLEVIESEFMHSAETLDGLRVHGRVDRGSDMDLDPEVLPEGYRVRSVMLSSESNRIIAKIDLVETGTGDVMPVDYKRGKIPDSGEPWEPDLVQLCCQAMVLRDNGFKCDRGAIYYHGSRRRMEVEFDEDMMAITEAYIQEIWDMLDSGEIPPPLENSPKCIGCSLSPICLPDELRSARGHRVGKDGMRRLYPARDDAVPVYVMEQGASVGLSGHEMRISKGGEELGRIGLGEVSSLCVMGNAQVTTQLIRVLCDRGIPIAYHSRTGWFYGITLGNAHGNVLLRAEQHRVADDEQRALPLCRSIVEGKVRNCRTLLRRNSDSSTRALEELKKMIDSIRSARSIDELMGLEGNAARIYFMHFNSMIRMSEFSSSFHDRNRRPPRDPINAMLSYGYAILAKDATLALTRTGFDPYRGLLHKPRHGRPSLALDLMEEFRPLIVDSTVIRCINNGEVSMDDFRWVGESVTLTKRGKKTLVRAYEQRMDSLISHPVFKYSISYRRNIEVQARMMSRFIMGELDEYRPLTTR